MATIGVSATVTVVPDPNGSQADRVYDKLCDAERLEAELIAAKLEKGLNGRIFGVSVDSDPKTPTTTVHCAPDLTKDEVAIVDATVDAHDPIPPLTTAQAARIHLMRTQVKAYIYGLYDDGVQSSLNALSVEGVANGFKNRLAVIGTVLAWVKTVLTYYYGQKAAMLAAKANADVDAVTWDFTQFDAMDPKVTLQQVVGIVD